MSAVEKTKKAESEKSGTPWYKSKRFYVTLLTALLPMLPPVAAFAGAYPEVYSFILSAAFGYVGVKTTQKIKFK
jgi:hypothetical protein